MSRHATTAVLSAYLDEELDARAAGRVEEHLEDCDACRRRLHGLAGVVASLRCLERAAPPPVLAAEVERRVARERRPEHLLDRLERSLSRVSVQPSLAVTFAMVFAFAAILYLFAHGVDRHQRNSIPVIIPPSGKVVEESLEEGAPRWAARRTFLRHAGEWREEGVEAGEPRRSLAATSPEGRRLLARYPELAVLQRDGSPVVLREGGEVLELSP